MNLNEAKIIFDEEYLDSQREEMLFAAGRWLISKLERINHPKESLAGMYAVSNPSYPQIK